MKDSLNDIVLVPSMLEALYKNSLVELPLASNAPGVDIRSLGENKRRIVIFVRHEAVTFLPDDELALLTRMLNACKLSLADVAIVNLARVPSTDFVFGQLAADYVLDFGALANGRSEFEAGNQAGRPVLSGPSLAVLVPDTEESKRLKTKLWTVLQKLFGL